MKFFKAFIFLLLTIFSTACATLMHGDQQLIGFSTNPSGGIVYVNGVDQGRAPFMMHLARNNEYDIRIELPGYLPYKTKIIRRVDALIIGNLLLGGPIGLAVDIATGSMYKLTPDQVSAELIKSSSGIHDEGLYFNIVLKADPSWEKIGSLQATRN
jgi:hypothetical protein